MATHIVGGEIYYQYVSNNDYIITLKIYRDCNSATGFDDPAYISIFDGNNNYLQTLSLSTPTITTVLPDVDNPCLTVPAGICVEEADYTTTVNLPPILGGYTLTYQRCCRNSSIDNIVDPSSIGSTYTIQIPDTSVAKTNSSPYYFDFPPIVICNNEPLSFDHSAIDPDGDSLVYSLCDPYTFDGSQTQPFQADPPPYNYVTFIFPYSGSFPLSSSPVLSINSQTGLLTGTPNYVGQFVVGICVSEYRNGQLLSTNKRDFQFNVTNCISKEITISQPFGINGDTLSVIEGCGDFSFEINRSANISGSDLIVLLSASGAATNGSDYNTLPDFIVIPAGQTSYTITVSTLFDTISEAVEDFILTISNDTACISEGSAVVKIINSEKISVFADVNAANAAICKGDNADLTANANGGDGNLFYLWSNGATSSSITVSPDTTKMYYVYMSDSCGNRTATDSVTVYVVCDVNIPNVFTPNGDDINDQFYIENLYMHPNSNLKIYNRWGRLVYENKNYDNSWNGNKLSDGTYYYVFDAPEINIIQNKSMPIQQFNYAGTPLAGYVMILRSKP